MKSMLSLVAVFAAVTMVSCGPPHILRHDSAIVQSYDNQAAPHLLIDDGGYYNYGKGLSHVGLGPLGDLESELGYRRRGLILAPRSPLERLGFGDRRIIRTGLGGLGERRIIGSGLGLVGQVDELGLGLAREGILFGRTGLGVRPLGGLGLRPLVRLGGLGLDLGGVRAYGY